LLGAKTNLLQQPQTGAEGAYSIPKINGLQPFSPYPD